MVVGKIHWKQEGLGMCFEGRGVKTLMLYKDGLGMEIPECGTGYGTEATVRFFTLFSSAVLPYKSVGAFMPTKFHFFPMSFKVTDTCIGLHIEKQIN